MNRFVLSFLMTLLLPGTAMAQMDRAETAAKDCSTVRADLPAELAGWSAASPLDAATGPAKFAKARLTIGSAVTAKLARTSDVTYAVRPEKPGGSVSYGGLFGFEVKQEGTYRIALGSGAWIDVLKGKKAITSSAHGHGPDCSGIRKMVDFPLKNGRYTLQIAANGQPQLTLLITRLP